jgi:hypothetical protein
MERRMRDRGSPIYVEVVLRRPDRVDESEIHDARLAVGDLIDVQGARWRVSAEETPVRPGVAARYVCLPAQSP